MYPVGDDGGLLNTSSDDPQHRVDANAFLFCVADADYTRYTRLW